MCMYVCHIVHVAVGIACGNWFLISALWVLGIEPAEPLGSYCFKSFMAN